MHYGGEYLLTTHEIAANFFACAKPRARSGVALVRMRLLPMDNISFIFLELPGILALRGQFEMNFTFCFFARLRYLAHFDKFPQITLLHFSTAIAASTMKSNYGLPRYRFLAARLFLSLPFWYFHSPFTRHEYHFALSFTGTARSERCISRRCSGPCGLAATLA